MNDSYSPNNIKTIRRARYMTQRDLADAIGVEISVISKYETGKIEPSANRVNAIAKALNVPTDALFSDSIPKILNPYDSEKSKQHKMTDADKSYVSSSSISKAVVRIAKGKCELCQKQFPYTGMDDDEFLESHYIVWLSEGGTSDPRNVVALCPNCHKLIHISHNAPDLIEKLKTAASQHIGEQYWL